MSFTVDDFQDLERLLEQRPEWRVRLRRLVLSDELLALPEQMSSLRTEIDRRFQQIAETQQQTDVRLAALTEAQQRTEARVSALAEAQQQTDARLAALTEHVATLTQTVGTLGNDVAKLKGFGLENRYQTRGHAYFGRLLRRAHVLSSDEITVLIDDATDGGVLTQAQADEILLADVIVRGKRREDNATVYLVVEVSWGVGVHDVERAASRARLLSRIGTPAIPVVAGEWISADARELAEQENAWQLTDGHPVSPPSIPS